MGRKKIDNRIRVLIENGVVQRHRSMFVIVGDHGRDQVVILHHMLSKVTVKARPSVLWCYKKELGFSSHRKKRMKQIQRKIRSGKLDVKEDDPFELFVAATNIRYCYYNETHKILGSTYGMCVLQDFEALTPNLLARTIETVEGGGIIVILLRTMTSLKQLCAMTMDVHTRYRTESHQEVIGRFNERFLLSLSSCKKCILIDDSLNILPVSSHVLNIEPVLPRGPDDPLPVGEVELKQLKESLQDTQPVGVLVNCCKTLDQSKALLKFIEAISEKTLQVTVAMTAARGRGKSATLGLAISAAVAFGYSNIFVTSPSPENLKTVFDFIFKGFDTLEYEEHTDYEITQSTNPEFNNAIVRVSIFKEHRQTIQYIHPGDAHKLGQAELVCIDEAAAIPLPLVKNLLGPYLIFMSSTVNGYEGTGRSLSLKLIQQLRQQSSTFGTKSSQLLGGVSASGRSLKEVQLNDPIRYDNDDQVEKWLNELLCLDATIIPMISSGCPQPNNCDLYYVNRDTLFGYHKTSESFLQRLMSLYVASHYKNTPNDLQMLSDAPAHHIFCLLGPVDPTQNTLPEVLCVIQVCLEGGIAKSSIVSSLSRGKRAAGDLIPWTVSQQFQDHDFPSLSGGRIVRIATHPDYQGMGYGSRALQILQNYYEGKIQNLSDDNDGEDAISRIESVSNEELSLLEERITPRKNLPPLLLKLTERKSEMLDYLGVSYGLTAPLLKFWKRSGYVPVYLRQTPNDLTGEHSCIMLKLLNQVEGENEETWLVQFWKDFRKRFLALMSYQFNKFTVALALSMVSQKEYKENASTMTRQELDQHFTQYDIKRLVLYSQNMVDYHLIMDLLPEISKLFFTNKIPVHLSPVQLAILLGIGLQHKTVEQLEKETDLPGSQLLALFNRIIRKCVQHFNSILEKHVAEKEITYDESKVTMEPTKQSLEEDLSEAAVEVKKKQKKEVASILADEDLSQYSIKGNEDEWSSALKSTGKGLVAIKSIKEQKRKVGADTSFIEEHISSGKKKKHKQHKKQRS